MSLQLNEIYNMDCIEGLKMIDNDSVDLIVTSPPYNVGIDYDSWNDCMPWEDYLKWCSEWLSECFRVLKPDGRICIDHYIAFSPNDFEDDGTHTRKACRFPLFDFREIMTHIGFNVHKIAIWQDISMKKFTAWGSWLSASSPNMQTPYEGILIAYKDHWKKDRIGVSTINVSEFIEGVSGIWNLGTTIGMTKANFPESLPHMCINLFSYYGDVVLDPFMGSGTTAKVAKELGRKYIGFEISRNYCDVALGRVANAVEGKLEDLTVVQVKEPKEDGEAQDVQRFSRASLIGE